MASPIDHAWAILKHQKRLEDYDPALQQTGYSTAHMSSYFTPDIDSWSDLHMQVEGGEPGMRLTHYNLMHGDKPVGHVSGVQVGDGGFQIVQAELDHDYHGQGLYQRMLASVLGHSGQLQSWGDRNESSQRSHEMLQDKFRQAGRRMRWIPGEPGVSIDTSPGEEPVDYERPPRTTENYTYDRNKPQWGSLRAQLPGELPVRPVPAPSPAFGPLGLAHQMNQQIAAGDQSEFDPETGEWKWGDVTMEPTSEGTTRYIATEQPRSVAKQ